MKLRFSIYYRTEWGQQLVVLLSCHQHDGTTSLSKVPLQTQDGDYWKAETAVIDSRRSPIVSFSYFYLVEDADGHELRREWTKEVRTYPFDPSKTYIMDDEWRDLPLAAHLYTGAYKITTKNAPSVASPSLPLFRKTLLFSVLAPQLSDSQQLAVIGSHPVLGAWNPVRFQTMQQSGQNEWTLTLNADALLLPLEFKYVVLDRQSLQLLKWEEGNNRVVEGTINDGEVHVVSGQPLRLPEKPWRAAGISVPVFALRSEQSCGVGDFGDLYQLVDWAAAVGIRIIQLLPINDTSNHHNWGDSNPYNIMSPFDLHPHYIDLRQLPPLKDQQRMTAFRRQQRELNSLAYSDYEAVDRVKTDYLRECFRQQDDGTTTFHDFVQQHLHLQLKRAAEHARSKCVILMGDLPFGICRDSCEVAHHPSFFHLDSQAGIPPDGFSSTGQNWSFPTYNWNDEGFMPWMEQRLRWLGQYFDALRIDHVLGYFRTWEIPSEQCSSTMGHFSPALPLTASEIEYFGLSFRREFLTRPFINDSIINLLFGIHASYVRDHFLTRKAYGLYELNDEVSTQRRVCEHFDGHTDENSIWIRDALCRLVSNVLFLEDPRQPDTYHPRILARQEPVFDALTSDEQEAYMRIYNNYFFQRHNFFWGKAGYDRLSCLLRSTDMLLCAEDLGMLPDCVRPVLDSLRILTLEVQQMPKHPGMEFAHLEANPVRSVCTITTHDMPPLRQWWQERAEHAQRYFTSMLQKQGRAPEQLPPHLAEEIIARHLYCPSMLCILQLQDWLAMDGELRGKHPREERINTPGDPYNRWQWRMPVTIEQLQRSSHFNAKLKTMIIRSKRT